MTRRRFYAPPVAFDAKTYTVSLAGDETRHLRDVLRLARGDEVFVFDGEGREFRCLIDDSTRALVTLSVVEEVEPASRESPLRLTLFVALLKSEKFDLVVQKTTELGVAAIVPLATARADVRLRGTADAQKRLARWQRIAIEAAKQSGRAVVPLIDEVAQFASLWQANEAANDRCIMFSERGGVSFGEATASWKAESFAMPALIGPEGGWSDEEIAYAKKAGCRIVTLGGRTLRAESAAIAVTALLQHLFGDLK